MGATIKKLRKSNGLSISNLSALCGLSSRKLSEIENDQRQASPDELDRIAAALNVTVEELRYRESKYRL